MPEKTCGDCKHFYPHPKDVRAPIGAPCGGECRVEPPRIIKPIMAQGENGQPALGGMLVSYLLLMETFPSCAKFEQSEERKDSFQIELVRK